MASISRRTFLGHSAAGVAATAASIHAIPGRTAQDKPNIIYILCDDLGYGDLACYDHPDIQTPNLDQLALDGIRFTDCYAAAPVCSPARAGFLTGRTPNRCCIYDHLGSHRWPHSNPRFLHGNELTIAELLKDVGYSTSLVGKWHLTQGFNDGILNSNPATTQPMPDDQGFDYYMATENNADQDHCDVKNFIRNGVAVGQSSECSSDAIITECIDWLDNTRDKQKPFFLFVSFHSPHEPVATPPDYMNMYA
ncbi:MAG: sulfatase-like hydrolase/transferase, partial [Chitinivibrionales bacterium]|nr:sulfatase-like hydrolase/transferase [Chitinivibrionales bacterium]